MKRIVFVIIILLAGTFTFAADLTARTGNRFGTSLTDFYSPTDKSIGAQLTFVSAIKKVENDLWCITLVTSSRSLQYPISFEYYIRVGDVIEVMKFPDIETIHKLKLKKITWNEAVFTELE